MKPSLRVFFFLLLVSNITFAQKAVYQDYDWDNSPSIHSLAADMSSYPAVFIRHNKIVELRLEDKPYTYFTEHKIIHINTNAGIEQFNKVYISMHGNGKLVNVKVRSISPDGTVTILKKENLKELKNVEDYGDFKIFAIEGVTIGGEIEYFYTTQLNAQMYGREVFQRDVPVLEASLDIIYPERFRFSAKGYNGLPKFESESLDAKRRIIPVIAHTIPALEEEEYSAYEANKMRVDYKLESNGVAINMVSWQTFSKRFLENLYESSATSKVKKFLKPLNLDNLSELEKVRAVEKYIKGNFTLKESGDDAYDDTKAIIENHVGSEHGILKLYMSCWEALGLSPSVVLCTSRFKGTLDRTYGCPSDVQQIIFYFPTLNQYLTPKLIYMRLGAAPDNLAESTGAFVDYMFDRGKIEFADIDFKTIALLDYTHNDVGVKASIKFDAKMDLLPVVVQEHFWQGYRAAQYRGVLYYAGDGTRRDEFIKNVTLSGIDNPDVSSTSVEGEDMNLSFDPENYLRLKTNYSAASLMEKAGDDYLFSIGKVIGKQSELYQERKRQMDIEFRSIDDYNHELTVEIPEGYTCTGLDALNINNELLNDEKQPIMAFHSGYEISGNKIIIKINEFYKVLKVPKEKYEPFREVINSSADFNKVVLIFHPKAKN